MEAIQGRGTRELRGKTPLRERGTKSHFISSTHSAWWKKHDFHSVPSLGFHEVPGLRVSFPVPRAPWDPGKPEAFSGLSI